MKLSAPIHVLRDQAKQLKLEQQISLSAAQNQIAQREGFVSWSQLMSKQQDVLPGAIDELLDYLNPGDLVLLGSRPRLGKTRCAARLVAEAANSGGPKSYFFTNTEREVTIRPMIEVLLDRNGSVREFVDIDCSENLCAQLVITRLSEQETLGQGLRGTLVVIDYLQVLDEKRVNPDIQQQVDSLKRFAIEKGCIVLILSQLTRDVDERPEVPPLESDVRLPNPLDLKCFNKTLFLYRPPESDATLRLRRPHDHEFAVRRVEIGLA